MINLAGPEVEPFDLSMGFDRRIELSMRHRNPPFAARLYSSTVLQSQNSRRPLERERRSLTGGQL
ncbi:hypothetical protein [Pengzhenrongella sp.]|uniref:hypothetical protein n=1 Tax=Pengzhenrongella sp. TaxID=2888820 RepID=UPI002F9481D4